MVFLIGNRLIMVDLGLSLNVLSYLPAQRPVQPLHLLRSTFLHSLRFGPREATGADRTGWRKGPKGSGDKEGIQYIIYYIITSIYIIYSLYIIIQGLTILRKELTISYYYLLLIYTSLYLLYSYYTYTTLLLYLYLYIIYIRLKHWYWYLFYVFIRVV